MKRPSTRESIAFHQLILFVSAPTASERNATGILIPPNQFVIVLMQNMPSIIWISLRRLFDAVCRCHKPVGAYLSGGLEFLISGRYGPVTLSECRNCSYWVPDFFMAFPGIKDCDETPYIADVIKALKIKATFVYPKAAPVSWYVNQVDRLRRCPLTIPTVQFRNHSSRAQKKKRDSLSSLTGFGGDEWLIGSRYHYADLVTTLNLRLYNKYLPIQNPLV